MWNQEHGFEPAHGIADYDVFYFDADLSVEAELAAARQVRAAAANLPVDVDVRNQARVHLWYELILRNVACAARISLSTAARWMHSMRQG